VVTLGDLTVANQTFGLIVSESGDWSSGGDPFDGLFGLAFTSISDMPAVTPFFEAYDLLPINLFSRATMCNIVCLLLFDSVVYQGSLTENAVTFFFGHYDNEDAATITFGTPPVASYIGAISWLNVTQQVYWQVTLVDIKVNGVLLNICENQLCDAILDTGTTLMTAPSQSLGTLLDAIGANVCLITSLSPYPYLYISVVFILFGDVVLCCVVVGTTGGLLQLGYITKCNIHPWGCWRSI
jgi:hypothetical protein